VRWWPSRKAAPVLTSCDHSNHQEGTRAEVTRERLVPWPSSKCATNGKALCTPSGICVVLARPKYNRNLTKPLTYTYEVDLNQTQSTHLVSFGEAVFAILVGFFFVDVSLSTGNVNGSDSLSLLALRLGLSSTSSTSALTARVPAAGALSLPLPARPRLRLEGLGLVTVGAAAAAAPSSSSSEETTMVVLLPLDAVRVTARLVEARAAAACSTMVLSKSERDFVRACERACVRCARVCV
jgi:hypothetical protein